MLHANPVRIVDWEYTAVLTHLRLLLQQSSLRFPHDIIELLLLLPTQYLRVRGLQMLRDVAQVWRIHGVGLGGWLSPQGPYDEQIGLATALTSSTCAQRCAAACRAANSVLEVCCRATVLAQNTGGTPDDNTVFSTSV
jgi:hypothetical protein